MCWNFSRDKFDRDDPSPPPRLPSHTVQVVETTAKFLHRMIRQCLTTVQDVLGQEGISLEFRHIASYLLWYCQVSHNSLGVTYIVPYGLNNDYVKPKLYFLHFSRVVTLNCFLAVPWKLAREPICNNLIFCINKSAWSILTYDPLVERVGPCASTWWGSALIQHL